MVSLETHAYVQVINCGDHGMHINISACAMSFVNVYNSGGSSRPNKVTASHAAQMLGTQDGNIKFVLPEVQHQIGVCDCGLFGLAFATSIFLVKTPQPYNIIRQWWDNITMTASPIFICSFFHQVHMHTHTSWVFLISILCVFIAHDGARLCLVWLSVENGIIRKVLSFHRGKNDGNATSAVRKVAY